MTIGLIGLMSWDEEIKLKRIIYRCPRPQCRKIWSDAIEEDGKKDYTEVVDWVYCPECRKLPKTPEDKLLEAIFGVRKPE